MLLIDNLSHNNTAGIKENNCFVIGSEVGFSFLYIFFSLSYLSL